MTSICIVWSGIISDQWCCLVRCVKVRGWSVTPVWLRTWTSVTARDQQCVLLTQMPALLSRDPVSVHTHTHTHTHTQITVIVLLVTTWWRHPSWPSVVFQFHMVEKTRASCHSFNPSDYFWGCDYLNLWNTINVLGCN